MAVLNPDVDSLLKKAEKNTKYFLSYVDRLMIIQKIKKAKEEMCAKSLFMKTDLKLTMGSLMTTITHKIKSL